MTEAIDDHDNHGTEPVTGEFHDRAWAADLERPEYAADLGRLIQDAIAAVENTAEGSLVQLVTHESQGHPSEYLYDAFEEAFDNAVDWEYSCQCNCGGHIVRVEP